ncbi:hypothetical protein C8J57DRAFT_1268826 [Mycena rebaudengoi]|nr:hypothetical protein C8J57DRAFT_1268826 [Mycena rebaudengoi]
MYSASLLLFCVLAVFSARAVAAPVPWDTNASTGMGGHAEAISNSGPSADFLDILSHNADNAADASSGDAFALDAAQKNSGGDVVEGNSVADGGLLDILTTGNGLGLL